MEPRPPILERLNGILQALGEEPDPQRLVDAYLGDVELLDDDQALFYGFAKQAAEAHPESAAALADAFVDLADVLVVSLSSDRRARIECALAWFLAAGEIYGDDSESLTLLRTRIALALPHRIAGDHAENVADAVATARHAVDAARSLGEPHLLASAYAGLGSVLLEGTPRPEDARRAFELAAASFQEAGDADGWAEATLDAAIAITEDHSPADRDARSDALSHAADLCARVAEDLPALSPRIAALAALTSAKVALERGGPRPLELAVEILEGALDGPADALHVADEAKLHVNLGVAYGSRLYGDPEENLERAILAFETARTLFHPALPVDAALTDLNLAVSYSERVRGEAEGNLRLAATAARRARRAFLDLGIEDLAHTATVTLGSLLLRHPPASRPFDEGVRLLAGIAGDASARPIDHALARLALGSAGAATGRDPATDLRAAADTFEARGDLSRWGHALCDLAEVLAPEAGDALYRRVLDRLDLETHPSIRLRAAQGLGSVVPTDQALGPAREAARAALHLASLAPDDPYRAHVLAEHARSALSDHVRIATEHGCLDEAHGSVLHALGMGVLSGLGLRKDGASTSGALRHEALRRGLVDGHRLRDELRPSRGRLAPPVLPEPSAVATEWSERGEHAPRVSFAPLVPAEDEAVLTTFVGVDGLWIAWQTATSPLQARWYGTDALDSLVQVADLVTSSAAECDWTRDRWARQLDAALASFARAIDLDDLVAGLSKTSTKLTLRPHRVVHLVPFAALPVREGTMGDRFPDGVSLVPLPLASAREPGPALQSPLGVADPASPLAFASFGLELGGVPARLVPPGDLPGHVGSATLLHVASHASLRDADPLAATLDLGAGVRWSPYELPLSNCELVVLAACSSAQADLDVVGASVVGLQSAFLLAGARHVVAALWPVDDLAAAVFTGRFYQTLASGLPLSTAFAHAQSWVRTVDRHTLRAWILTQGGSRAAEAALALSDSTEGVDSPFSSAVDWSAFALFEVRQVRIETDRSA